MAEKRLFVILGARITDFESKMRQGSKSLKDMEKAFKRAWAARKRSKEQSRT